MPWELISEAKQLENLDFDQALAKAKGRQIILVVCNKGVLPSIWLLHKDDESRKIYEDHCAHPNTFVLMSPKGYIDLFHNTKKQKKKRTKNKKRGRSAS